MRGLRTALAAAAVAAVMSGCGGISKPAGGHGVIDDQRSDSANHLQCLQSKKLPAVKVGATQIRIGAAPNAPVIDYQPSPGAAQGLQITGRVTGAEVIGSALLYPNAGPDHDLSIIEKCLSSGVKG